MGRGLLLKGLGRRGEKGGSCFLALRGWTPLVQLSSVWQPHQNSSHQTSGLGAEQPTTTVDYNVWGDMLQRVSETKIRDIDDLRKCLMRNWRDLEQRDQMSTLPLTSGATVLDHPGTKVWRKSTISMFTRLSRNALILSGGRGLSPGWLRPGWLWAGLALAEYTLAPDARGVVAICTPWGRKKEPVFFCVHLFKGERVFS